MIRDSKKIRDILVKNFSNLVPPATLDRVAGEISGLGEEWEEVFDVEKTIGANISVQCEDICQMGELHKEGTPVRVFKKKTSTK